MQVVWTDPALERVEEIAVYIAGDDPDAAVRWTLGLFDAVQRLVDCEKRASFTARIAAELRRRTGAPFVEAFRTLNVVFLLTAQRRHWPVLEQAISECLPAWKGAGRRRGVVESVFRRVQGRCGQRSPNRVACS
jgi:toxin ParE1/3/4